VTFYEHGETPGLGGEIENPSWRKIWEGKKITDENGEPQLRVVKGDVNASTPESQYKIDGLAGATLTSDGVTNLIQFWVGENGFGPYLEKIRQENSSQARAEAGKSHRTAQTHLNVMTKIVAKQG
jgi:Na+-transporting NADH:ubiquinone oxidoreductase subunit C